MRSVLGIDAAWSVEHPSGVALVAEEGDSWRLVALANSYDGFLSGPAHSSIAASRPHGSIAEVPKLLDACRRQLGAPVDLVAIDMPLAHKAIERRRASDDAVSKSYGARHCGTHSPSISSPGKVSDDIRRAFGEAGYALQTKTIQPRSLIEVYPHPALVELSGAPMKLKYKVAKMGKHWPVSTPEQRRVELFKCWAEIVELLESKVIGVRSALPAHRVDAKVWELKSFEDMLDAVICAWVGICAIEDTAKPFGDHESAIWIPVPH